MPSTRAVAVGLLVLALVCRLGVVAATPHFRLPPPGFDPPAYDRFGASIARTGAFPDLDHRPTASYPPGYPYFLGALYAVTGTGGGRVEAARIAGALLGTLAVGLIGLIAWRVWGRRAALAALGLAAVFPPLLVVGESLLTEALFVPLELAAVAAALQHRASGHHYRWALLAGFLAGLAALTRSNALLLLLPLALAVSDAPRRSWRGAAPALALVVTCVLTVAPWTVRNAVELHAFVPVTTQPTGLAGVYNDTSRTTTFHKAAFRPPQEDPHYAAVLARSTRLDEAALYERLVGEVRRYVVAHPAYVLEVGALNSLRMFHVYDRGYARATARDIGAPGLLVDVGRWSFYPVALLALAGAFTAAARRAPGWFWLTPVLLMTVAFIGGFIRYRAPVDPFIVLLASLGLLAGVARLRARGSPRAERHPTVP